MIDRIKMVIDKKVRPYLGEHGGDIEVVDIRDGIVKVRLLGSCKSCPAAKLTFEDIIRTAIIDEVPEIKDVELDDRISEDLLMLARKILSKE